MANGNQDDAVINERLYWIENGLWSLPGAPGIAEAMTVPGLLGRTAPLAHPLANMVGSASWTEDEADARIAEVSAFFDARGLPSTWIVGPSTRPENLPEHLIRAGWQKAGEMAGMTAPIQVTQGVVVNPAVRIVEIADVDEAMRYNGMFAASFDLPLEVSEMFLRLSFAPPEDGSRPMRTAFYVAFLGEEAVSFASSTIPENSPILQLSGAGTLPASRGNGVYTALVARRLHDAQERYHCTDAVIQAVRTTSAPICLKLGFQELCNLQIFLRVPGGSGSDEPPVTAP